MISYGIYNIVRIYLLYLLRSRRPHIYTRTNTLFPNTTLVRSKHPRMLEKAPHDGTHPDVVGQPRHAGAQRAYAAHHQIDLHAGLAGLVQLGDDLLFEQIGRAHV